MQYINLNVVPNTATKDQPALITYDFTVFGIEYSSTGWTGGFTGNNEELKHYCQLAREVSKQLRILCKAFVFQCERCPTTGRPHFQGRIKCKNRLRLNQVVEFFQNNITRACRISATAKENSKNFFYVTKDETRVIGPWKDTDNEGKEIPWQLAMFPNDLDWQAQIKQMISVRELRFINCVILTQGAEGKTICCQKLVWEKLAEYLPYSDNHKDLLQACHDVGEQLGIDPPAYIFDLPRALRKDKMRPFFSAIEDIKSGWSFDLRYGYRRNLRGQPNVWVFTNKWPNIKYLSTDRWKFWKIVNNKLEQYSPEEISAAQLHIKMKNQIKKYGPQILDPKVPTPKPITTPSKEWFEQQAATTAAKIVPTPARERLVPKVPTPTLHLNIK